MSFLMKAAFTAGKFLSGAKMFLLFGMLVALALSTNMCVNKIHGGGYSAAQLDSAEDEIALLEDIREEQAASTAYVLELSEEIREAISRRDAEWADIRAKMQADIDDIKGASEGDPCPVGCVMPGLEE